MRGSSSYVYGAIGSIPQAVDAMTAIAARLPPTDGVAAFNRMYLQVTRAVAQAIDDGVFTNSHFLDHLDIVFANHYLSAVGHAEAGADVPRCWDVLWQHRKADRRAPIQFALAGMNAHINHDLVLALVATFTELDISPHDPSVRADFERVDALLASLDGEIRRSYEHGLMLDLERHLGRIEDCVDTWSITRARAAAWQDALVLWKVRDHTVVRRRYERALDEATALAGRCLLLPLPEHSHYGHASCARQRPMLQDVPTVPLSWAEDA
jgi:hypothetical protein